MRKRFLVLTASTLFLLLSACSDTTTTAVKKEPEKPQPVTGQTALYRMYQQARPMGTDTQVLNMSSVALTEVPDVPRGKAAEWQASFASPSNSRSREFTYCIVEILPTLHKGAFAGPEGGWSGAKGTTGPFDIRAVKIDSDAAYETALKQAGDYDKKNPNMPISITLEKNNRSENPVWRIIWGPSASQSNFSVLIDASTGAFREKLH
jgi:hypothetical protein